MTAPSPAARQLHRSGLAHRLSAACRCGFHAATSSDRSRIEMRSLPPSMQLPPAALGQVEHSRAVPPNVFPGPNQLRALFDQRVRPPRVFVRDVPRPCENIARLLQSAAAVMRVPEYSAASTTSTPIAIPLMLRLRIGKFCGAGKVLTGNSEINAPPDATICSDNRVFSFGYGTSIPVPSTATVHPFPASAPRCEAVSTRGPCH